MAPPHVALLFVNVLLVTVNVPKFEIAPTAPPILHCYCKCCIHQIKITYIFTSIIIVDCTPQLVAVFFVNVQLLIVKIPSLYIAPPFDAFHWLMLNF